MSDAPFALRSVVAAVCLLTACVSAAPQRPQERGDSLLLVTFDGARVEEMFGGLDPDIFRSTLPKNAVVDEHPLYRRFGGETPEIRRQRLMPFFWDVLMSQHGSIAGNPRVASSVRLTNAHRFSYPLFGDPRRRS
jgi:hypothetical protein